MTKQTIKITGLADYSPLTNALAEEYNGLQSNAAKRRLMLDCLRYGYALEKMGLGALMALLERPDMMALPEHERASRFVSMAMSLMGTAQDNGLTGHQPFQPVAAAAVKAVEPQTGTEASLVPERVQPTPESVPESDNEIPGTKPYQVEESKTKAENGRPKRATVRLSRPPASDSNKP